MHETENFGLFVIVRRGFTNWLKKKRALEAKQRKFAGNKIQTLWSKCKANQKLKLKIRTSVQATNTKVVNEILITPTDSDLESDIVQKIKGESQKIISKKEDEVENIETKTKSKPKPKPPKRKKRRPRKEAFQDHHLVSISSCMLESPNPCKMKD